MPEHEPNLAVYLNTTTGYYHVRVYWPDTKEKPYRPSLRVKTRKEALARFEIFKRDVLPGLITEHQRNLQQTDHPDSQAGDPRISDLANWYVTKYCPSADLAPRSIQKYAQVVDDFTIYCRGHNIGRVSQVSYSTILEFTEWLSSRAPNKRAKGPKAPKTRNDVKATLRRWFNCCVDAGQLDATPVAKWFIKKPKGGTSGKRIALTPDECTQCIHVLTEQAPYVADLAGFLLYTGCRISDALDLRWSQIDGNTVRRRQVKGNMPHQFSLNAQARAILDRARQGTPGPHGEVFTNTEGRPWTYNGAYRAITRALTRGAFWVIRDGQTHSVDLHTLRHTYATISANLGCPAPILMQQLGHTSIETTMQYYHPDPTASAAWSERYAQLLTPTTEQPGHTESHRQKKPAKRT